MNTKCKAESEEARLGLNEYKVAAAIAVSDMESAREFYERKLGLSPATGHEPDDNRAYRCGEGSVIHVYSSPGHAGRSTATLAGWYVDDVEGIVDELALRASPSSATAKGQSSRMTRVSPSSTAAPRSPTSGTRTATPSRSPRRHDPDPDSDAELN
jgi:hypothetical protein